MDKIAVGDYLNDYIISDVTASTVSNYSVTEYLYLFSPSPQLLNWFTARGWIPVSWTLTDPSAITDYAYIQKNQFDPQRVLQVLVDNFTTMFNEGRTLNDTRYDEILALLAAALDKTEDGLILLETDEDTFEALVESVISNLSAEFTTHNTDASNDLDDWGTSEQTRIDTAFDAKESALQEHMIGQGFYNTTNWTATSAGLTREESVADTEVNDMIAQRKLELKRGLYKDQVDIRRMFLEARNRLITLLHTQGDARMQIRNRVIEAVSGFAERRTDEYPSFLEPLNAMLNVAINQHTQGWA